MLKIIDTFPAFRRYWEQVREHGVNEQVERWRAEYLAPWPFLIQKQIEDYASQEIDWRDIARERVFPHLPDHIEIMDIAYQNLIDVCETVFEKANGLYRIDSDVIMVIYVGIGCGAGWQTRYENKPAVLFGLENIAECGWSGKEALSRLVSHELGHMIHYQIREKRGIRNGSGAWWQLYSEGFAQYCESLIVGTESWHQTHGDEDWLSWCRENESWLAGEFLEKAGSGEATRSFFGSWYDIQGKSQTGYYLGCEVVKRLKTQFELEEIASLENIEDSVRPILIQMQMKGIGN